MLSFSVIIHFCHESTKTAAIQSKASSSVTLNIRPVQNGFLNMLSSLTWSHIMDKPPIAISEGV